MKKQKFHTTLHFYLALFLAFSLTLSRVVPLLIALMLLNWIIEGDFKNKFIALKNNKFALLFISFYLLHVVGLLYTQNIKSGLFDLEVKLSLLLFPLLYGSRPLSEGKLNQVFIAFISGLLLSSVVMLSKAIFLYFTLHENHFYYEEFASTGIHLGYMAMYINFGIGGLLLMLLVYKNNRFFIKPVLASCIILFFLIILILLSSKMGLIELLLQSLGFLIYYICKSKKYLVGVITFLLCAGGLLFVFKYVPTVSGRFENAIEAVTTKSQDKTKAESTAVRLLIWKAANSIIRENILIGTGTGDAKDCLLAKYEQQGLTGALAGKLNAHNAYYQVFIALGSIGLITLCIHLFLPMYFSIKNNNFLYLLFLLIVCFNFLTESMLDAQAGVVFFAFFNSLLCFKTNTQ
ncbi:MAG: O-antigen ligase family protein [Bacteroidia bacterium]